MGNEKTWSLPHDPCQAELGRKAISQGRSTFGLPVMGWIWMVA